MTITQTSYRFRPEHEDHSVLCGSELTPQLPLKFINLPGVMRFDQWRMFDNPHPTKTSVEAAMAHLGLTPPLPLATIKGTRA